MKIKQSLKNSLVKTIIHNDSRHNVESNQNQREITCSKIISIG